MKTLILSLALTFSASIAQASSLNCTTNVDNDPRKGSTDLNVSTNNGVTSVAQITEGGMAHFVTAPKKFVVTVTHEGPEVVIYSNSEEGFELEVGYQPIGGSIRGSLITEVFGQRISVPVACKYVSRRVGDQSNS